MDRLSTIYRRNESNSSKQICFDVRGQEGIDFFTGGLIMETHILTRSNSLKLKCIKFN